MEIDQGRFTPLVFTVNGGMADECKIFYSRLASLLSIKRGVKKSPVTTWIKKIKCKVWYHVYVDSAYPPQEITNKFIVISRDFLGIPVLIPTVYLGGKWKFRKILKIWNIFIGLKCTSQPGLRSFYQFSGRKIVWARIL